MIPDFLVSHFDLMCNTSYMLEVLSLFESSAVADVIVSCCIPCYWWLCIVFGGLPYASHIFLKTIINVHICACALCSYVQHGFKSAVQSRRINHNAIIFKTETHNKCFGVHRVYIHRHFLTLAETIIPLLEFAPHISYNRTSHSTYGNFSLVRLHLNSLSQYLLIIRNSVCIGSFSVHTLSPPHLSLTLSPFERVWCLLYISIKYIASVYHY